MNSIHQEIRTQNTLLGNIVGWFYVACGNKILTYKKACTALKCLRLLIHMRNRRSCTACEVSEGRFSAHNVYDRSAIDDRNTPFIDRVAEGSIQNTCMSYIQLQSLSTNLQSVRISINSTSNLVKSRRFFCRRVDYFMIHLHIILSNVNISKQPACVGSFISRTAHYCTYPLNCQL